MWRYNWKGIEYRTAINGNNYTLSHSYQNICNLIGHEDVNMTILLCSPNMRKKYKMADSQSPTENQLKQHVLIWVTATLWIKWKVNLENFLVDSETGTRCIYIKTFELNF